MAFYVSIVLLLCLVDVKERLYPRIKDFLFAR
jgi:hypothetical protein